MEGLDVRHPLTRLQGCAISDPRSHPAEALQARRPSDRRRSMQVPSFHLKRAAQDRSSTPDRATPPLSSGPRARRRLQYDLATERNYLLEEEFRHCVACPSTLPISSEDGASPSRFPRSSPCVQGANLLGNDQSLRLKWFPRASGTLASSRGQVPSGRDKYRPILTSGTYPLYRS